MKWFTRNIVILEYRKPEHVVFAIASFPIQAPPNVGENAAAQVLAGAPPSDNESLASSSTIDQLPYDEHIMS